MCACVCVKSCVDVHAFVCVCAFKVQSWCSAVVQCSISCPCALVPLFPFLCPCAFTASEPWSISNFVPWCICSLVLWGIWSFVPLGLSNFGMETPLVTHGRFKVGGYIRPTLNRIFHPKIFAWGAPSVWYRSSLRTLASIERHFSESVKDDYKRKLLIYTSSQLDRTTCIPRRHGFTRCFSVVKGSFFWYICMSVPQQTRVQIVHIRTLYSKWSTLTNPKSTHKHTHTLTYTSEHIRMQTETYKQIQTDYYWHRHIQTDTSISQHSLPSSLWAHGGFMLAWVSSMLLLGIWKQWVM
jgi:hypothetical protein